MRRTCLSVILLMGLLVVVVPLAFGLPGKTSSTRHLTDAFRPVFAATGLRVVQRDIATVDAMAAQAQKQALPGIATTLKMTPAQFNAFVVQRFPDVAQGVQQLPAIAPFFDRIGATLTAQQRNFEQSDSIPLKHISVVTVPWLLILPGVVLVLVASAALLLSGVSGRAAPAVAVIIGVVLVILPLAVSIPSKTRALEHFTAALRPVFSAATSDQAARYLTVTQRMNNQLQSEMIPALAEALHRTPAQVDGLLLSRYPYFATGVSQLDGIVARTRALVRLVRTNVNNFDQTASIPLSSWAATTMLWLFLIPGLLLAVFGAALIAGVGLEQRTSPSPSLPASGVASR